MREHQIAINLKPQQFELLQRLARERGFKSVTAYVKQKIVELALGVDSDLSALGAETMQGTGTSGGVTVENQALLVDLTRIHNELRAFVGRSLEDEIAAGNSAASSSAMAFELPPPGQIASGHNSGQAASGMTPFPTASSDSANAPAGTAGGEAVSSQVLPSNNLGGFGFRLGGFAGGGAASRFQAPLENADRLSGYREIMDDLEELADRAFAISPRLGALDEDAPTEAATGRGGRSGTDSIVVEPILPDATKAPRKGKADPNAAPQANPISMVKPMSAADLPGPDEMAAAAPVAPEPVVAGADFAAVPDVAAISDAAAGPDAAAVSDAAPVPFVAAAGPDAAAISDVAAAPAQPIPLPGDDLLSELLDESLVAHAETPRPADNPFAAGRGLEKAGTESSAGIIDATAGAPPFVDPESADDQSSGAQMEEQDLPLNQSVEEQSQEPVRIPPSADDSAVPSAAAYNDSRDQVKGKSKAAGQSGSRGEANDEPQDPHTPGHSNLGSGPPPKRRRT